VKKKDLEIILQQVQPHPSPNPTLEQYQTPADIAADVLFLAAQLGDIQGKKVVDLGCGTGVLAIGAKVIGAREVVAIDMDQEALTAAMKNASLLKADVGFLTVAVEEFPEACDTVIMNPPFGSQNPHADAPFLETAFRIATVVYSFHHGETEAWVFNRIRELGGEVTHTKRYTFPIPRQFAFHRQDVRVIAVTLFRSAVIAAREPRRAESRSLG